MTRLSDTSLSVTASQSPVFSELDLRILSALDVPRTTRELSDVLWRQLWEAWAEEQGIDWDEIEAAYVPARLIASSWAKDQGMVMPQTWKLYPRLCKLERTGLVVRVQIEGKRPMLWRKA